ncbi:cation:dicarboxylate symporter family transporter [Pseudomonas sp. JR33AA]|uniref:cation:dicarboxylate symporter family transporter n=1 Tax=Pseudomonas sp. JR33AA TaxID=2899113 RepID=UPI001F36B8E8|nr:cation:dicarboxylase symporter family transporter [Pseudomonas sp. JR33AA]MCE5977578.1 cation:dicarboxylase symporter family transporter [Pseudomonas sp. JR33AA]
MAKTSLVARIIVGLVLGVVVGALLNFFPEYKTWITSSLLQPLGDIFIKMMKMIVIPLVFACMVGAIAGNGDSKAIGRVGVKALFYFFVVTSIAIVCGLLVGNLAQPGVGANLTTLANTQTLSLPSTSESSGFGQVILNIIPDMFVILTATLTSAGLPVEGIAFIAGVYRLMDMPITALNVLGNALAPLVVAKWENQYRMPAAPVEAPEKRPQASTCSFSAEGPVKSA